MSEKSITLDLIKTSNPLIWVYSREEQRFLVSEIDSIIRSKVISDVFIYDARGSIYDRMQLLTEKGASKGYDSPQQAIQDFSLAPNMSWTALNGGGAKNWDINAHGYPEQSVLFVLDMPAFMTDPSKIDHTSPIITRQIKWAVHRCRQQSKTIIMVNHHKKIPIELAEIATYVEHELPGIETLKKVVIVSKDLIESGPGSPIPNIELTEDGVEMVAKQLKGLTQWQAENVLALANQRNAIEWLGKQTKDRQFKNEVIQNEKSRLLKNSSALTIIHQTEGLESIGGMDYLKQWAADRETMFRPEAREDGIDMPKGVLVVGPGGTGKSAVAQALAKSWNRQLLRLDLGACMGSLLGESENKFAQALRDAEAQEPCVLFIDEFEKLFAGATGEGERTGGTFQRMYGAWLYWTQSRKADVFVVATTNSVESLPPPILRARRFDAIVFVDLPGELERKAIFEIHLNKRGWNHQEYEIDTATLANLTPNRTGAEIEQIVIEGIIHKARTKGFGKMHKLTTEDLQKCIADVRTSYEMNPNESESIRKWAMERNVLFANSNKGGGSLITQRVHTVPQKKRINISKEDI